MVTPHLPPYQAANAILPHLLGTELEARGHGVSFLTFATDAPVRRNTAYVRRRPGPRATRIPQLFEAWETRRRGKALVAASDVVHVHSNTWMNQVAARQASTLGKPYVLTHYGTEIWHHDGKNRAFRDLNARAAHVTFYSQALLDRARELSVPFASASVEYPAVDATFRPLKDAERATIRARFVGDGEALLLNVKRLHPLADQATLLRAFGLLRREGVKARLLVAGSGDEEARLKVLARELGLDRDDSVRFLGLVPNDEVARLHGASDLFVLSSKLEATPTVALEALASGTRVVSTDNPGGVELGTLFPEDLAVCPREDAEALASAIRSALRENRRASATALAGIEARFRLPGLVARYERIYERALGR